MSIWSKHPNYTPDELRLLTTVAAETLIDAADDPTITPDVLRVSARSAAVQISEAIKDQEPAAATDAVRELLETPERASEMALFVLDRIRQVPTLADDVAEAYEARRREMSSPELFLLAGAAVILAIKIKNLR